jgi:hypothetical protein
VTFTVAEKNVPAQKIRDMFQLFFGVIGGSASDVLVQRTSMQELLCDLFLRRGIPESLKYGTFAGEARLYTMHAIKPAWRSNGPATMQADGVQLFCGKVFEEIREILFRFLHQVLEGELSRDRAPDLKTIQRLHRTW